MRTAAIGLLLLATTAGCKAKSSNTPEQMFEAVIAKPIPAGVTAVQGAGTTWQGYSLHLRFRADTAATKTITQTGYELVPCDEVTSALSYTGSNAVFSPPWSPAPTPATKCYKGQFSNGWSGAADHALMVDETGLVHFAGVGA